MTPARALALSLALALVLGCGRYGPPSPMAPSPTAPDSVDAENEAAPAAGAENGSAAR